MTRPRVISRLGCAALFALAPLAAVAQNTPDRIVALVVSSGDTTERADRVQAHLDAIGAETLRSINPNNARLRSMMRRFADEAQDARKALVYLDMPALRFDERDYVATDLTPLRTDPGGVERPTDVFTHAIPLQAFGRMAAEAAAGGAVVLQTVALPTNLAARLTPLQTAPDPAPGTAPVAVVAPEAAADALASLELTRTQMEMHVLLRRLAALDAVSVSFVPEPSLPTPILPAPPLTVVTTEAVSNEDDTAEESLDDLAFLEKSLSRAAKRNIQRGLRRLGHYNGLVDGVIGPQSRDAIVAFQAERDEAETGFLTRHQLLDLTAEG